MHEYSQQNAHYMLKYTYETLSNILQTFFILLMKLALPLGSKYYRESSNAGRI